MGTLIKRAALLLIPLAALVAASPASAATLAITTSPDVTEDVTFQLHYSGTTDSTLRLYAKRKPVGGQPCAPTYSADDGSRDVESVTVSGSYTQTYNRELDDSGDYLYCAWLQTSISATSAEVAASLNVTARVPRSTGTIQVPAQVNGGAVFQVGVTAQTEIARRFYVDINNPGIPCGANYAANPRLNRLIESNLVQGGPTPITVNYTPPRVAGVYTICGYVQQSSAETVPEATFAAPLNVVVLPTQACINARNLINKWSSAIKRYTADYKKWKKKAKKARGKKRRAYAANATRVRRKLKKAQIDLSVAESTAATECAK